jgi:hypothetical protein
VPVSHNSLLNSLRTIAAGAAGSTTLPAFPRLDISGPGLFQEKHLHALGARSGGGNDFRSWSFRPRPNRQTSEVLLFSRP